MSQENVELVRKAYEAWNRGDLQWQLDHMTPDHEVRTAQVFPDTDAVYRGRAGFSQFWKTFREPWESLAVEIERIEAIGEDRVLALYRLLGRGRDGVEVTLPSANLITIEKGLATRTTAFLDWQKALEAAGLSE